MIRENDILRNVRVAKPCPTSWEAMEGDDRVRYCGLCKLNVFNLSDMTREEAEKLILERQGRLCVRYYQRRDGTVLTKDCPVGVRAVRRKLAYGLTCAFTLFLAVVSFAARRPHGDVVHESGWWDSIRVKVRSVEPFKSVLDWVDPPRAQVVTGDMVVGNMAGPTVGALPPAPIPAPNNRP